MDLVPSNTVVDEGGQNLCVHWPASKDPTGNAHRSVFTADWLRKNCYTSGTARKHTEMQMAITRWGAGAKLPAQIVWSDLLISGKDGEAHLLRLLESLSEYGIGRVTGVPAEATEELARLLGPVQETFYGYIWDTAPREAGEVRLSLGLRLK